MKVASESTIQQCTYLKHDGKDQEVQKGDEEYGIRQSHDETSFSISENATRSKKIELTLGSYAF